MKAEQAKKIADQALEQLSQSLTNGRSEELTRYFAMLAKFHKYSFGNVMLILSQMPDATHVAGFNSWKQLGRFVKKGEKGILIIAPMILRQKEDRADDRDQSGSFIRFRAVYVFDVSQTEGEPLPEPSSVDGDPGEHLARLQRVIADRGITLDQDDLPLGADGVSRGGRISIRAGLTPAHAFSVTAHELAHELLHRGDDRPDSKTVRETEAEAVAFVVCQAIGLDSGTAASDYIQLYSGDIDTLIESLERIQRTAAEIIAALHGVTDEPAHAA